MIMLQNIVGLFVFMLPFFVFLIVFVGIYALLLKTKILGDNQVMLNFIAALCIAAIGAFTGSLVGVVSSITPWIVLIFFVLLCIFAIFKFFGAPDSDEKIWDTIGGRMVVYIIILIVVLIALTQVFEPQLTPYVDGDGNLVEGAGVKSEVLKTMTHPRLLSALFILITTGFTIKLLVDKVTP